MAIQAAKTEKVPKRAVFIPYNLQFLTESIPKVECGEHICIMHVNVKYDQCTSTNVARRLKTVKRDQNGQFLTAKIYKMCDNHPKL